MKKITLPLSQSDKNTLRAGECVLASGTVYTARDCAHKRLIALLDEGKELPFTLEGAFIYYAGPCPAPEGKACGSCGPTTSARINAFAPRLLHLGLGGMIGKGEMSDETKSAIKEKKAVYFAAIGGAGAFYGNAVKACELIAFPDLLSEAIYKLQIEDFPLVVAYDPEGNSIYDK